jgi:hypothetical protein
MGEADQDLQPGRHVTYLAPDMRRHGARCGIIEPRTRGDLDDGRIAIRYDHGSRYVGQRDLVPTGRCYPSPTLEDILAGHARDLELKAEARTVLAAPQPAPEPPGRLLGTVIIPCGREKLDRPAPAGQLYVGGQHRLARKAADALTGQFGGTVRILSAWYGLLDVGDGVFPYDVTVGDTDAIGAAELRVQCTARLTDPGVIVSLLPGKYARLLDTAAGRPIVHLLDGSRGLLEQRARLAATARNPTHALAGTRGGAYGDVVVGP